MAGIVQEQNLEKQMQIGKQMGCMAGFLQIFDRHQILTGKRLYATKRLPLSTVSLSYLSFSIFHFLCWPCKRRTCYHRCLLIFYIIFVSFVSFCIQTCRWTILVRRRRRQWRLQQYRGNWRSSRSKQDQCHLQTG